MDVVVTDPRYIFEGGELDTVDFADIATCTDVGWDGVDLTVVFTEASLTQTQIDAVHARAQGAYLDPVTGGGSDGVPPATAPTVTVTPGLGTLLVEVGGVANADPTSYRLWVSTTNPPETDDAHLVADDGFGVHMVTKTAGVAVVPGTVYHARAAAYDVDGQGPVSAVASGTPEEGWTSGDQAALEQTLAEHDATMAQHAITMAEHDTTLAQHASTMAGHDSTLSAHASTMAGHDTQLAGLDTQLNDPVTGLNKKLTDLDTEVGAILPITAVDLADNAVTSAKIADNAVTQLKVADAVISSAKLVDGAVSGVKIAVDAITETKIAADAITTPKIATGAVTAGEIAAGAITAGKIAAGAVTATELAAGSVTAGKIAAGAVTATEIAADAVSTSELAANAVTAAEIAANAIVAGKIATNAVTAGTVAAGAVTAGTIAAGVVTALEIAADAVTASEIAAGAVTATEIAANTITAAEIAAGAITASELAVGAVTAGKIAAGAITATEIAAGAITTTKLAAGAVTATEIAAGAITALKIGASAVEAGKIAAGAVTAGTIAANAVTAGTIAAGAVTATTIAADAIDGKTITGPTIRTASSGERVELGGATARDVRFYTGNASETSPGVIENWAGDALNRGVTRVQSPVFSNRTGSGVWLFGAPATGTTPSSVSLRGDIIEMATQVYFGDRGNNYTPVTPVAAANRSPIAGLDHNARAGSTGSASNMVISHNLGATPKTVIWSISDYGGVRTTQLLTAKSATDFTLNLRRADNDALVGAGVAHTVHYVVIA